MYQLTKDPDTILLLDGRQFVPRENVTAWAKYEEFLAGGGVPGPVPPVYELYSPAHFLAIRSAAWAWMSEFVKARRYDSIETCCSYFNSSVERYQTEARAMVAWRDSVNLALEQLVVTRPAGAETWEQVKPLLPQPEEYDWPAPVELPLDGVPPVQLEP